MPPKETPAAVSTDNTAAFIARWAASGAAERANYQLFLAELCELLGVQRPEPATPEDARNGYVFERSVTFQHGDGTSHAEVLAFALATPMRILLSGGSHNG